LIQSPQPVKRRLHGGKRIVGSKQNFVPDAVLRKRTVNRILRMTLFWGDLFPFPNGDQSNGEAVSECRERFVLALAR
jgi:hypothetical protein